MHVIDGGVSRGQLKYSTDLKIEILSFLFFWKEDWFSQNGREKARKLCKDDEAILGGTISQSLGNFLVLEDTKESKGKKKLGGEV